MYQSREIFEPVNTIYLPWHIRAAQLLKLSDLQYDIDLGDYDVNTRGMLMSDDNEFQQKSVGKDWYATYKSYVTKYGDTPILIFCSEKIPHQGEIDRVAKEFIGKFKKLIIAIESEDRLANIRLNDCEIEFVNQEKLLRKLISFKDYQKDINNGFKSPLEGSERSLNDIYIPLNAYHYMPTPESTRLERGEDIPNVEQYVLDWAQDENHSKQHLAIVGEYGQGKSVLSLKIAKEMLAEPDKYSRIPIIIELRGASPRTLDIWGVLGKFANPYGLNAQALYQLHRAGKLLIILEGFDEMDLVGDTEMLMAHFQQLWQLAREPQAKIIITGRPNLFTDDPQRRQALGIHTHRTHLPYTRAIHLEKMTDNQICQALRNTTSDVREGILQALADSPDQSSFAELVTRPSTLYQLSTIWGDEISKETQRLNAPTVIGKFIQSEYDRQSAKHVEMPLTADERSYFIMGIAVAMMMESGYTNQIKKATLHKIVQKLLENFPEISPYRDTQQGNKQGKLTLRLKENQNALDTVFRDVIAGGILVIDLSGSDIFRFAHKSHLEYLISDFYVTFILQDKERQYDLKLANGIRKALKFKNNLKRSVDVDSFTAQLIASRIRLRDEKGQKILIKGNENAYSVAIFEKWFPPGIGRDLPNQMFWLYLHKSLIPLHGIVILTITLGGLSYWFESKYLAWATISSQVIWYISFYYFRLLGNDKQIEIVHSQHANRLRLWQYTAKSMDFTATKPALSRQIKTIIFLNNRSYDEIALLIMSLQLALIGTISGGVAFGFLCTLLLEIFSSVDVLVFASLGAAISAVVGSVAGLGVSPLRIGYGVVFAVCISIVLTIKVGSTFAISVSTIVIIGIIIFIYKLYAQYKKALKAEQTRQAEAGQPDA